MTTTIFEKARIIDPSQGMDEIGNFIISENLILASGKKILHQGSPEGALRIDCTGKTIIPGLVDVFVSSGSCAQLPSSLSRLGQDAAAGGITSLVLSPDLNPIIDNTASLNLLLSTAREHALVNIYSSASITKGLSGQALSPFHSLKESGAIAFSEGDHTVSSSAIMQTAFAYAADLEALIMHQPQDNELAFDGVMNEGLQATRLGLSGIAAESELITLERDLILARRTQARYHACQISSSLSLDSIRRAKEQKVIASAGVSINNLCFNEYDIGEYNTAFRLFPPLRREEDRLALIEGLRHDILDVIVSSHKPFSIDSSSGLFAEAPSGSAGLRTLFAASLRLYHNLDLSLLQLVKALSTSPAKLFGLPAGTLKRGSAADFLVVDLETPWIYNQNHTSFSPERSCFYRAEFLGKTLQTWVAGQKIYDHTHESFSQNKQLP